MSAPDPRPTQRFSNRVRDYVAHRPGYPPAVVEALREAGLRPGHRVADVGSGTGISTRLLLDAGAEVWAIEPNTEMRAAAEAQLSARPGFHSVAGSAERTGLSAASVDWVVAAQAFHWFDVDRTRAEWLRILRPDRAAPDACNVALLWNNRRADTPFLREYEALLNRHGTDFLRVRHENVQAAGAIGRLLAPREPRLRTFENVQPLDLDGLTGRTLSASYMPARGQPGCDEMLADLRRLFERHASAGRVEMVYETRLYLGWLEEAP